MTLFGRQARLVVGDLEVVSESAEDLRIAFQVKRSTELAANTAKVQVFNLSEDSRSRLDDLAAKTGTVGNVSLEAGLGERKSLFCGDRAWVGHRHDGATWVTEVEMLDGGRALSQIVDFSGAADTTAKQFLDEVLAVAKLAYNQATDGDLKGLFDTIVFGGGKSFSGTTKQALKELADAAGLSVSVQDCTVVFASGGTATTDSSIVLSPSSGLIGSPERYYDPENPKASLLRGECLLEGEIRPGFRFVVDTVQSSGGAFGVFKPLEVVHTGDTHGGANMWRTEWEAKEVQL